MLLTSQPSWVILHYCIYNVPIWNSYVVQNQYTKHQVLYVQHVTLGCRGMEIFLCDFSQVQSIIGIYAMFGIQHEFYRNPTQSCHRRLQARVSPDIYTLERLFLNFVYLLHELDQLLYKYYRIVCNTHTHKWSFINLIQ